MEMAWRNSWDLAKQTAVTKDLKISIQISACQLALVLLFWLAQCRTEDDYIIQEYERGSEAWKWSGDDYSGEKDATSGSLMY